MKKKKTNKEKTGATEAGWTRLKAPQLKTRQDLDVEPTIPPLNNFSLLRMASPTEQITPVGPGDSICGFRKTSLVDSKQLQNSVELRL